MEMIMAHYYFHLRDFRGDLLEDEEGSDSPAFPTRGPCIISLREILGDSIRHGQDVEIEALIVVDERGDHAASVPIAAVLPDVMVKAIKNPVEVVSMDRLAEYRRNADGCRAMAENSDRSGGQDGLAKAGRCLAANATPASHIQMLTSRMAQGHRRKLQSFPLISWPQSTGSRSAGSPRQARPHSAPRDPPFLRTDHDVNLGTVLFREDWSRYFSVMRPIFFSGGGAPGCL